MFVVQKDNLIVNITFAWEHAVAITTEEDEGKLVSHRFPTYSFNEGESPLFYKYSILRPEFKYQLGTASPGGAGRNRVLNRTYFLEIPITKPQEKEQLKIAQFLELISKRIEYQRKLVDTLKLYKRGVFEALFEKKTVFENVASDWQSFNLGDVGTFYNGLTGKGKEDFGNGESKYITYMNVYKNPISTMTMCERVNVSDNACARGE